MRHVVIPRPPRKAIGLTAALCASLCVAAELPELVVKPVVSGLDQPTGVTNAGDDRLFVIEKAGRVLVVQDGAVAAEPFLDLTAIVESDGFEQGLLSITFHPVYEDNGRFFVSYTDLAGDLVLARYEVADDPRIADPESARTLLVLPQPSAIHQGGQLQFGPDGLLYFGVGDGGGAFDPHCNAQRLDTLLGKILRLDVDAVEVPPYYGIPPGNPALLPGHLPGAAWALGLRNPWRFSFDRQTGDLFIADVGQQVREEVDFQPAGAAGGANYGWKVMEGTLCSGGTLGCPDLPPPCGDPRYTTPILEYEHAEGNCAVIGGHVYRGPAIPELSGHYLYGDFCSGRMWLARREAAGWGSELLSVSRRPRLTSFGENVDGEIYLTTLLGDLLRLEADRGPGLVELATDLVSVSEGDEEAAIVVLRSGGGAVSVSFSTADLTALSPFDYESTAGTLSWDEGDRTERVIRVPIVGDAVTETVERFGLTLDDPDGPLTLGVRQATIEIADDDPSVGTCDPSPSTLCLNRGRFQVTAAWRSSGGGQGQAEGTALTADTGLFWFFDAANVELVVKILDACSQPAAGYWLFATGLTDVGVELEVLDTVSGLLRRYESSAGVSFAPIQDTTSFADCP